MSVVGSLTLTLVLPRGGTPPSDFPPIGFIGDSEISVEGVSAQSTVGLKKGQATRKCRGIQVNDRCLQCVCIEMVVVNEIQRFLALKATDLKKYLRDRNVPVNDEKHQELAEKAFWAKKLGLPVKPTDEEADQAIQQQQSQKLFLDGGLIHLPRPETVTNGWEDGPASLPDTSRDHLDSYIKAGM